MHEEIVLGGPDQRFTLEPVEQPRGRATLTVARGGITHPATLDCVIDPAEVTVVEPACAGDTTIRVATSRSIGLRRPFDLCEPGVERQRVAVTRIFDSELTLRRPLAHAITTAAVLTGARITATIDPTWANDTANLTDHLDESYVLTWQYETPEGSATATTTADLVRVPQRLRVTPDDVERRFPGFAALGLDPTDAIAEAFELVRRDVRTHRAIQRARDAAALRELAIIRAHVVAIEYAAMFRGAPYATLVAAEERYFARLAELVEEAKTAKRAPGTSAGAWTANEVVSPQPEPIMLQPVIELEAFKEWLEKNPLDGPDIVFRFVTEWLPRLRTNHLRRQVAMVLRATGPYNRHTKRNRRRMLMNISEG